MKFTIKHEVKGRIRIYVEQQRMNCREADILQYYLSRHKRVTAVKIHEETGSAAINYVGEREAVICALRQFSFERAEVPETFLQCSGRELNNEYKERMMNKVVLHFGSKMFLPVPVRSGITLIKSAKYLYAGIKTLLARKMEVPVLDAAAIGVSILRNDMKTAASTMFLLGIGEIMEEWTHKKSVDDLARSMSLNTGKVWMISNGTQIQTAASEIREGDRVVVHVGNVVPFDGTVTEGEAMLNQASLTGEPVPVRKVSGSTVYAGTVVEEGEITLIVRNAGGSSRYEKIVTMIEESEKLKSNLEGRAEHLADRLVPYTLGGTILTWLLTRSTTKALAVLMVDFSCALKLAMPIAVLSAIRESSVYNMTVKGGKFLEKVAEADTIVFDKTGTLTKAQPTVSEVITFNGETPEELLRIAACLEEHFPHSMAKAVVDAAKYKGLLHEEMHSKVEYIVAHGISTTIEGKHAVIGSSHFVFEDEGCDVPAGMEKRFKSLPDHCSHLYLAIEGRLAAVICVEDPLREEAAAVVNSLKKIGISKVVMMTGDSEKTAAVIAREVGVDEYYSEVLPEDKAQFVAKEKALGRKVIMIGDGINDSPALSAADVGIAISDGAEIAREIADITMSADNLYEIVTLKAISDGLMKRINSNYRKIVSINAGLICLGVAGVFTPAMSALLHNTSTLYISLKSMQNIIQ